MCDDKNLQQILRNYVKQVQIELYTFVLSKCRLEYDSAR